MMRAHGKEDAEVTCWSREVLWRRCELDPDGGGGRREWALEAQGAACAKERGCEQLGCLESNRSSVCLELGFLT